MQKIHCFFDLIFRHNAPLIISIFLALIINILLFQSVYSPLMMIGWLTITVLLISYGRIFFANRNLRPIHFLALVIGIFPVLVRVSLYDVWRFHGDEFITGYFSAKYDVWQDNFFDPVPASLVDWVCQFPSLFFFLQKIFFSFFGATLLTVKLSVLPYVWLIGVVLFLYAKHLFNNRVTAVVAVVVYSFLAFALYFETLGLHFVGSTAIFLLFIYLIERSIEAANNRHQTQLKALALLSGIALSACYFFYSSSYSAVGFWLLAIFIILFRSGWRKSFYYLFFSAIAAFLMISPFAVRMLLTKNFYLAQRYKQVALLDGEWSGYKKATRATVPVIMENLSQSMKSLYSDNFGGHGGYDYNHKALFDYWTIFFIINGFIFSLYHLNRISLIFILGSVLTSFFGGMVMTIPPPAYHRFTISIPFICLLIAGFYHQLITSRGGKLMCLFIVASVLSLFMMTNYFYFQEISQNERKTEIIDMTHYITRHYSDHKWYIAAFPGFALEKFMYFIVGSGKEIKIGYHSDLLRQFNPREKYAYIIIFPKEFETQFIDKDPHGRIEKFGSEYSLFVN